ncbi:hypothetical protein ARSEF4850_006316 [Beauveria asiatica]
MQQEMQSQQSPLNNVPVDGTSLHLLLLPPGLVPLKLHPPLTAKQHPPSSEQQHALRSSEQQPSRSEKQHPPRSEKQHPPRREQHAPVSCSCLAQYPLASFSSHVMVIFAARCLAVLVNAVVVIAAAAAAMWAADHARRLVLRAGCAASSHLLL